MCREMTTETALLANCRRSNYSDESMLALGESVKDRPMSEMTNLEMSAWLFWNLVEGREAESDKHRSQNQRG